MNKHKVFNKTEMNNEVLFDKTETNLKQHFITLNLRDLQPMCFPDKPSFCPVSVPICKKKQRFSYCKSLLFSVLSGKRGSNPRPAAWEAAALPTELLPLL